MHETLKQYVHNQHFSGNIREDVYEFLVRNNCQKTANHCMDVGVAAGNIAERFGADVQAATIAGYLHDVSAVIPNDARIEVSEQLGIEVLPEERQFQLIIHQKLSKVIAQQLFNIENPIILDAVGCHTTLRKNATELDIVLFVADKILWDQQGVPPYLGELNDQLNHSLKHGAYAYIRFLWTRKDSLRVIHPWLREAYYELKAELGH